MNLMRRFRRCRSGATAVEFAIIGLIFLMLCIGIIEIGRAFNVRSSMLHAVDMATRTVLLNSSATEEAISTALRDSFHTGDPSLLKIFVATETISGQPYRRLEVSYPLEIILVGFPEQMLSFSVSRLIPMG